MDAMVRAILDGVSPRKAIGAKKAPKSTFTKKRIREQEETDEIIVAPAGVEDEPQDEDGVEFYDGGEENEVDFSEVEPSFEEGDTYQDEHSIEVVSGEEEVVDEEDDEEEVIEEDDEIDGVDPEAEELEEGEVEDDEIVCPECSSENYIAFTNPEIDIELRYCPDCGKAYFVGDVENLAAAAEEEVAAEPTPEEEYEAAVAEARKRLHERRMAEAKAKSAKKPAKKCGTCKGKKTNKK